MSPPSGSDKRYGSWAALRVFMSSRSSAVPWEFSAAPSRSDYDSVSVHLNQTPLRSVRITAEVGWTQADSGTLPIYTNSQFQSFLADTIAEGWPRTGSNLGGGWTVVTGHASTNLDTIP